MRTESLLTPTNDGGDSTSDREDFQLKRGQVFHSKNC